MVKLGFGDENVKTQVLSALFMKVLVSENDQKIFSGKEDRTKKKLKYTMKRSD